jgi:NAD(P)H-hydrate epimerase
VSASIVTSAQMRAAEQAAFARGISADALMEEAGEGIARAIAKFFPRAGKCVVFAGKGHNAGDAFVAARLLAERGWQIETHLSHPEKELASLTSQKLDALRQTGSAKSTTGPTIVLDGLLGLGARPPLRGAILRACRKINRLRKNAFVVAIDLPSGLDGDSGDADENCVRANLTVTIGAAKRGLLSDGALDFIGRLEVASLDQLRVPQSRDQLAIPEVLCGALPRRKFSAYKNQFGRIGVVAGSRGFCGAAVLCSLGALRAGGGLVELFVPEEIYEVVGASAAPEVMVKPLESYGELLDQPVDVWAIGPGLGKSRAEQILALMCDARQPMVIDADGLNILSTRLTTLKKARGSRLLTPHPGEMERLCPAGKMSRAKLATTFCEKYGVTLLLKGSRTIVAGPARGLSYNTTGNPGMATGGMGDILTGVCGSLLGQKLAPNDAARLGAWLCGRAAELAISSGQASEESLLPSDVIDFLGAAFNDLRVA